MRSCVVSVASVACVACGMRVVRGVRIVRGVGGVRVVHGVRVVRSVRACESQIVDRKIPYRLVFFWEGPQEVRLDRALIEHWLRS